MPIDVMGASFKIRRDPSKNYKYGCLCDSVFSNPYTLVYHVGGNPSRKNGPCQSISRKAADIVAYNLVCDDETKPINYRPKDENGDIEDVAEMEVDEDDQSEPDVEIMAKISANEDDLRELVVESVKSNHPSQADNAYHLLMKNDAAFDTALQALDKARADVERARADTHALLKTQLQ